MGQYIRMKAYTALASVLAVALAAACSPAPVTETAEAPPATTVAEPTVATAKTVSDFELKDQNGVAHRLHAMTEAKAIVVVMQGVGCPIVQKLTPTLKDIQAEYEAKGVKFVMLNPNIQDTPEKIAAEAEKFDLHLPMLKDDAQAVSKELGAVRTAETFVIEPGTWKVLFHGPIDDRLTYGREKAEASNHYLKDALNAVLAGQTPPLVTAEADGCIINYVTPEAG